MLEKIYLYFSTFVIVMLMLTYFGILIYNISNDISILQTYYVDSYDPKNLQPIPVPDIVFFSSSDFNITCIFGNSYLAKNCSNFINSTVYNSFGNSSYVKIFHEQDSNLEFHMTNLNKNGVTDVTDVIFTLNFFNYSLIYTYLFDGNYNPFRRKEDDLVNYNFDKYDAFDISIASSNLYRIPNGQKINIYFSRSLMNAINNWGVAEILGIPLESIPPKYFLSTRFDIPIINNSPNLSYFRLFLSSTVLTQIKQKRVATVYNAFSSLGGLWSPLAGIFFFLFKKPLFKVLFSCFQWDDDKDKCNKDSKV